MLDMDGTLDFLHYIKEIGGRVLTIFVLSGEGTREDMNRYGISPDCIYDSVKELCLDSHINC